MSSDRMGWWGGAAEICAPYINPDSLHLADCAPPPHHVPHHPDCLPPPLTLRACTTVSSYRVVAGMADGLCFAPP